MTRSVPANLILATVLASCAAAADPASSVGDIRPMLVSRDGSPEAIGLLAFLNDTTTTLAVLDDQVPLERRAALYLIAHRNGRDGLLGTRDDDLYGTYAEVDAVAYVGTAALAALEAYVGARGWIPTGSDTLGTWDGVAFTADEAEAVLDLVNDATAGELDNDVPLDGRAVNSIVAARPIATILDLSNLYYVGGTTLNLLKAYTSHCSLTVATATDDDATDFTRLLALSTTMDTPYGEVVALQTSGCDDWQGDAVAEDILLRAVWDAAYDYTWEEAAAYREVGTWTAGGTEFSGELAADLRRIDDLVDEERWDPAADAEGAALYADRSDLVAGLTSDSLTNTSSWAELTVDIEASECSQSAVALVDLRTGQVLVAHRFPGC